MGEYAEMMIDGTCCMQCGEFIDQDFPGLCASCRADERREARLPHFNRYGTNNNPKVAKPTDPIRDGDKMACPFCVRKVKVTGFGDHMLTQHRDKWTAKPATSNGEDASRG
jgi:hypothetical protein